MAITEQGLSHDEMGKIAADPRRKCGQCDGNLTVAWGGSHGIDGYILRCSNDMDHNTVERLRPSEEERWFHRLLRGEAKLNQNTSTALMTMTEKDMVERVGKAKFVKDLTAVEAKRLALACITYGFDPIMHELTIYQGNPYVSVDGRYRKAQETGQLDGVSCRPATKEERQEWEVADEDKFFRAEVYRKDAQHPFVGWGKVTAKEIERANEHTPLATNPMRMAEKRAEVQALRKAFSIPLPSAEYIGVIEERTVNGVYSDVTEKQLPPAPAADPVTGEIEEGNEAPTLINEEQLTAIKNGLAEAGLDYGALGEEFNGKRAWNFGKVEEMTSYQAELVKDWLAEKVAEKAEAEGK